jgi:YndJ-like protein
MNYAKSNRLHWLVEPLSGLSLWLKMSIIVLLSVVIKVHPTHPTWAIVMPVFAALVLVPIGVQLIRAENSVIAKWNSVFNYHLTAAILLAASFVLDKSVVAGCLALPYFVWCSAVVLRGLKFDFSLTYLMTLAAFGFLTNAAAWLVFDRFDYQPLNFSAWIVLLTGAHFHYAGFALTLSLALLLMENPDNKWAKVASYGVLSGVVLTATGITTTQLGYTHFIETIAGVWMSTAAFLSGIAFLLRGLSERSNARYLFIIGAICLILAMILAFLYALRTVLPLPFLSIPTMQAVHGSLNALGFGTLTLFGWAFKNKTIDEVV